MAARDHGQTASGTPLTDEVIEEAVEKLERIDVNEIGWRRPGRPRIGSGPAKVESVRLDPELHQALADRARREDATASSLIRAALRQYLGLPPTERA
jgi:Ribbon-helix-helix protein, copG family